ncbi:hypothetical protein ABZ924_12775 [Streptomyces sp. NPDC046876]|uniref:hypothetical protein n=1 Tax=Streptomyces sp. NPDC046876 TaxID=3155616 RepID=UPI0033E27DA5
MTTSPNTEQPFLSLHTAVVLIGALITGLVVGGLSRAGGVHPALAVLAGLTAGGGAVPVLRGLIR